MKIAVITGTSTGVGTEFSIALAKRGYKVYATMRNLDKSEFLAVRADAENVDTEIKQLDVTNTESVNNFFNFIKEKEGRIDLLINNTGAGFLKPSELSTEEEIKAQLDLNVKGLMRCTNATLPLMRQQKSGHIINISSVRGLVGQPFNEIYCATKFAVEGYTEGLASYLTPHFNIHFTMIEPGGISTEFACSVMQGVQQYGGVTEAEYANILERYLSGATRKAEQVGDVSQTVEECVAVALDQALVDSPPLRLRTSEWAENFTKLKTQNNPDGRLILEQVTALSS